MKRVMVIVLKALGAVVGLALAFLLGSIVFFRLGRAADFRDQARRLELLSSPAYVEEPSPVPSPETVLMATRNVSDRVHPAQELLFLPLTRLSVIATHNSYHRQPDPVRLFFLGLGAPGWPDKLRYSHETLYDQLRAGLRSFELDLRHRKGGFEVAHVPLVDDRTACPDLALAFAELALWSSRHPDHLPITVILELKNDWGVLDPAQEDFDRDALMSLDALVRSSFPATVLFTPDELRGDRADLPSAIRERGWPAIIDMLGTVMVILHRDETYRLPYVSGAPALEGRAMFTCAPAGSPDAAFAIVNDPADPSLPGLLADGWMIRTRADADLAADGQVASLALAGGAQLVSTDFPPVSAGDRSDGQTPVRFANGATAIIRP